MTFQPVIPTTGYAGWAFLSRTLPAQQRSFDASPQMSRDTDYFRANIARARSAEDLVADRRLLSVALGAFGLDDDLPNRAFIRKVLAEGTLKDDAFANRLADKRYAALALEFGYGNLGARTGLPGFADRILGRYLDRQFERAVGRVDPNMRLALGFADGLSEAVAGSASARVQWFALMGNPPLRKVMETALGLPAGFGSLDIDQQLAGFRERADRVLGTDSLAGVAADPALRDKVIRLFLIRAEAQTGPTTAPASAALALLSAMTRG